ncbi:MAG: hypothetical protein EOR25_29865 [Mesorhizobium sp.]|uniref:SLC13 family permease n=1 Tax=Mesorhizobium sp. TaxID=1871066 RepID=UPI000FE3BAE0|nr:SLC13 family permease [Mesorhizobium sp.]RWJ04816.1 MAG: hypothetical protein EOR24_29490 [Mesorhizobium sp.]RWJ12032.1 MAG: hypothetical protein EOR25_29865 [Mesorhizobium sp.]
MIGRSGILDPFARRIPEFARSETGILAILCNLTAGISVFMNNIGALALMIPVVTSVCRVSGLDQRRVLMQVSFAALLGGLCSIIGTPANLIVSNQLAAVAGEGFAFFDYAWVGVPAAFAGLIVLLIWPGRILGAGLRHRAGYRRRPFETVVAYVEIGPGSPLVGAVENDFEAKIHGIRRGELTCFSSGRARACKRATCSWRSACRASNPGWRMEPWLCCGKRPSGRL